MSALVLLNLLNELRKRDKMRGLLSILYLFRNEFNKSTNDRFYLQVLAFQKSWRSLSPIIVCILAHCMLPF